MNLFTELNHESEKQKQQLQPSPATTEKKTQPTSQPTQKPTSKRDKQRARSRQKVREMSRTPSRQYPTRDEVQMFSFQLRDELRVKVQAEVPHQWQGELDDLARTLRVKKLELYRYIIGDFLGKTQRGRGEQPQDNKKAK